ncbi:hypothetical protein ACFVH6_42625 [Spirillospora sp. NPDC127200]
MDRRAAFRRETRAFEEAARPAEVAGTASDLMLFLWNRVPADRLEVSGDRSVLDRYFLLVPPV